MQEASIEGMSQVRGRAKLAGVLGACAVAAALLAAGCGGGGKKAAPAATTGALAPLTVTHPDVPIVGGGVAVDLETTVDRTDLGATLTRLPGVHRVKLTIYNSSNVGAIQSFQWYPPIGTHIQKVLASTGGRCRLTGLTGFGGAQFPGVVLNPNVLCEGLDLAAPTCMCRGDGGEVSVSLALDREMSVGSGELRLRTATVAYDRIPVSPEDASVQQGKAAAGAGKTAGDDAPAVLAALDGTNIALQLTTISTWVQNVPSTCRVRQAADDPRAYNVYVFWTPWLAAAPYVWLNMRIPAADPRSGSYSLGTADPVLAGGKLNPDGRTINPASVDTTILSRYGEEQARRGKALMTEHAGETLQPDGQDCRVLKNGALQLVEPAAG